MFKDSIFAPSSGGAPAGISVVRVSGPSAGKILNTIAGVCTPKPRHATHVTLTNPKNGEPLDTGLFIWFPAPASFTGEDVVEFQIHGGVATVEALCRALGTFENCRLAEPGEFSRRAFYNEKLDLAELEGLSDLIAAETEAQRKQALQQLSGSLSEIYEPWRKALLECLAHTEAVIDFPEEELPDDLLGNTKHNILGMTKKITQYLDDGNRGEKLREGFQIVIAGAPNVGKSSLLNYLAERDVAIVSEQAGTTRDVIEVRLDLGGYPVTVADTADLRQTRDAIEYEGVKRAESRATNADLTLFVFDILSFDGDQRVVELITSNDLVLINKADLLKEPKIPEFLKVFDPIIISVKNGQNLEDFLKVLTNRVVKQFSVNAPAPLSRLRHREALERTNFALQRSLNTGAAELMAEDLRIAARELGKITGRVDVEDVLDVIFHEFCIGK